MAKPSSPKAGNSGEAVPASAERRIAEEYLGELKAVRDSNAGEPETSFYPALSNLFNAVGASLKPRVRCVMNLRNQGAGLPDGGLFTADQFQRPTDTQAKDGQLPSRGAIEAKSTRPDVRDIAAGPQVAAYLNTYGIVIVTNLREFLVVERGAGGHPLEREAFSLADDETTFWQDRVAHPRRTAQEHGRQLVEFIRRAALHAAPLIDPKQVAWFLASYARDALARVELRKDLPALQAVRTALEEALGMKFTAEKGEHFFRSTLVQTLFYGVFSAWVRWHKDRPTAGSRFDWRTAEWTLHVPFIRVLYEQVASKSQLEPLGLVEVLDWAAGVLNRVDRGEFFKRFELDHAVQYFYEPFLEAYDPELRKALGVWYTPPEIVKYQVARVDTVLREELDLPDGLADPNVIVLDPCCGTGAYLLEVLRCIGATLRDKGGDALVASDLKKAAADRVFGFEILPAPFVVAHLQLGLMLQAEGAPLSPQRGERVGVYLTNSLTGWEPPKQPKTLLFPELQEERDAAERIKREKKILVVLGNPPYNAFAGVSPEEEQGLVEPYKKDLNKPVAQGGWGIKKFNLDDLYVRFFRLAERRIAEMTGQGVVSFISNFSYLDDPSFVVMRQRFLAGFDKLWFDCLNGDSRETGKLTPDGRPDPSVFSTEHNREGIRVGTAVCLMLRNRVREKKPIVRFRQFWGASKRADVLKSLKARRFDRTYARVVPGPDGRFAFRPESVAPHYTAWPRVIDLCAIPPSNGLMEKRGGGLIDIDRDRLAARMRDYFNPRLSWDEYKARHRALTGNAARFNAKAARSKALAAEAFDEDCIRHYAIRPFDVRWCYYTGVRPVWNEPRPSLYAQCWSGNAFLMTRPAGVASPEGAPFCFTSLLGDNDALRGHAYYCPIRLMNGDRLTKTQHATLFDAVGSAREDERPLANLSKAARDYLATLCIKKPDVSEDLQSLLWWHVLAVGYSPAYLRENADGIRRDWPRIPLPEDRDVLDASARLGRQVAALLDTETDVPSVTNGRLRPVFRTLGVCSKLGGGAIDPSGNDLVLTAGWGYAGKDGATMPGKGKSVEREYNEAELKAIGTEAAARGRSRDDVRRLLGAGTFDIFLNDRAYWRNIPANVWNFHIGGYQVIKKWLSYREQDLLGRALTPDEVREVTNMARRIAALVLLQPELDANYQRVKNYAYDWPAAGAV